ncbi:testis-expressed protein 9 isoform X1 [Athalia rosae]|uniref:testis-expressed protein 9 isoform X1 n=2 Tax=Athalia rosae TaxID=37344 RepID=UPI0020342E82|nr:testis-expressed protein 9 isoform X1 [Athalia rosae]
MILLKTMSDELLSTENKFYVINGELERKSKALMKHVDSFVNNRLFHNKLDSGIYPSDGLTSRGVNSQKCKSCDHENDTEKTLKFNKIQNAPVLVIKDFQTDSNTSRFLTKTKQSMDKRVLKGDESVEETFGKQANSACNDAVVRFFKSKAKILETELGAMKLEYKKKCDYSNELQVENKKIDEERVKLYGELSILKDTLLKIEAINTTQLTSLRKSESEIIALKKEIDSLKKEMKVINQNSTNLGVRLNRASEDNERLRKALKCSRLDEKELRDENRRLVEIKKSAIINLEKQRIELLQAFKKQILLIDNLKKQRAHLEADMLVTYSEEELSNLLNWKVDDL